MPTRGQSEGGSVGAEKQGVSTPGQLVCQSAEPETDVCFSLVVTNAIILFVSQLFNFNSSECLDVSVTPLAAGLLVTSTDPELLQSGDQLFVCRSYWLFFQCFFFIYNITDISKILNKYNCDLQVFP